MPDYSNPDSAVAAICAGQDRPVCNPQSSHSVCNYQRSPVHSSQSSTFSISQKYECDKLDMSENMAAQHSHTNMMMIIAQSNPLRLSCSFPGSAQVKNCASRGPWDGAFKKRRGELRGKGMRLGCICDCATSAQCHDLFLNQSGSNRILANRYDMRQAKRQAGTHKGKRNHEQSKQTTHTNLGATRCCWETARALLWGDNVTWMPSCLSSLRESRCA